MRGGVSGVSVVSVTGVSLVSLVSVTGVSLVSVGVTRTKSAFVRKLFPDYITPGPDSISHICETYHPAFPRKKYKCRACGYTPPKPVLMGIGASDLVAPWPGSIPLEAMTDEHLDSSLVVVPYYPDIESLVVILVEPLHGMGLVQ